MRWVTGAAPHVMTQQGLPKMLREMAWEMNPIKGSPGRSSWLMDAPNTSGHTIGSSVGKKMCTKAADFLSTGVLIFPP